MSFPTHEPQGNGTREGLLWVGGWVGGWVEEEKVLDKGEGGGLRKEGRFE